jgi:hypothetical protein
MQGNGWIKLHRDIQHHWIFQRDDYFKAWILLLCKANHKDYTTLMNNELVEVKRGQVATSLKKLGLTLHWSPSKVKRFLKNLEKDKMIYLADEKRWTHLTINNYETYQQGKNDIESQAKSKQTKVEHNQINIKKDKNEKKSLVKEVQLKGIKEQLDILQENFSNIDVKAEYERMEDWLLSSGKRYKNYLAFFRNWLRKASQNAPIDDTKTYTYNCDCGEKESFKSEFKDLYKLCSCGKQMKPTI